MEKFTRHTGIGVPLRRSAVDTDQIIPAVYLKRITRTGFEDALFASWRKDPSFVLNREEYRRGSVLVAGPDFGTGSSREHAVWALKDYGFRAVLAPKFADIFRGNSGKQGLVAGVVAQEDVEQLWKILETEPGTEVTIDLESRTASAAGFSCPFQLERLHAVAPQEGLDDVGITLHARPPSPPTNPPGPRSSRRPCRRGTSPRKRSSPPGRSTARPPWRDGRRGPAARRRP